jgi:hypothetical protein
LVTAIVPVGPASVYSMRVSRCLSKAGVTMNKPTSGLASLLASFLALSAPLVAVIMPTGVGEEGFGRYVVYRFLATAATGLLVGAWALAAAISVHRREGVNHLLLLGLGLGIAAAGWCISWWLR